MSKITPLYVETNGQEIEHIPMNLRLKQLRLERGLTMQNMADFLGVKNSTYAGYEASRTAVNHRYPKTEMLIKISEKLDTSTDYLLCKTNDRRPTSIPRDVEKLLNVDRLEYKGVIIDDETRNFIKQVIARTISSQPEAKRA